MTCQCSTLPEALYLDDYPPGFRETLTLIATGDWVELYRSQCGQMWRIDGYDKLRTQLAIKIREMHGWEQIDSKPLVLDLLTRSHGGCSDTRCLMADCRDLALKGLAFCAEHLYAAGVRR
ncbi:hypothetical protein ACW73L_19685 [Methylolobus aquaticus]